MASFTRALRHGTFWVKRAKARPPGAPSQASPKSASNPRDAAAAAANHDACAKSLSAAPPAPEVGAPRTTSSAARPANITVNLCRMLAVVRNAEGKTWDVTPARD